MNIKGRFSKTASKSKKRQDDVVEVQFLSSSSVRELLREFDGDFDIGQTNGGSDDCY